MKHYLVQLLLPLYDNNGQRFAEREYLAVREELVERFGGITAYTRAPASGLWQESEGKTVHDEVIVYEVMTRELDKAWWRAYRGELERRFRQELLIVRAQKVRTL